MASSMDRSPWLYMWLPERATRRREQLRRLLLPPLLLWARRSGQRRWQRMERERGREQLLRCSKRPWSPSSSASPVAGGEGEGAAERRRGWSRAEAGERARRRWRGKVRTRSRHTEFAHCCAAPVAAENGAAGTNSRRAKRCTGKVPTTKRRRRCCCCTRCCHTRARGSVGVEVRSVEDDAAVCPQCSLPPRPSSSAAGERALPSNGELSEENSKRRRTRGTHTAAAPCTCVLPP